MYRRSVQPIFSREFCNDIIGALCVAAPVNELLDGATLDLWTGAHVPTPDSLTADMPVATFVGYAQDAALVWTAAGWGVNAQETINTSFFQAGGGLVAPGEIITGYRIGVGGVTVICERFVTPCNFDVALKFLDLDVVIPVPFFRSVGGPG